MDGDEGSAPAHVSRLAGEFHSDDSAASPASSGRGQGGPDTPVKLLKSDIPRVLSMLSQEDRVHFSRSWFSIDCRRRYRELTQDDSNLLRVEKLQGIVKMFPTLSLDFSAEGGRCIQAVDSDLASLLSMFDSDGDGALSAEDFVELARFCHAWRASFYIKTEDSTRTGSGTTSPTSPTLQLAGKGLLQGKKKKPSRSSSQGALKAAPKETKAVNHPPPVVRGRRASGFGERMLGLGPAVPEKEEPAKVDIPHAALAAALAVAEAPAAKVSEPIEERKDEFSFSRGAEVAVSRGRRMSAPALVNFLAAGECGGFYASMSGIVNKFDAMSDSEGLSDASEDE